MDKKTENEKREKQKRETWIKNVMRIQGFSRVEAELAHEKIHSTKAK